MRVLVTGGAGFIGSHLVEQLLAQGIAVRVLDNLSTGRRANLPAHPALEFIEGDIRDDASLRRSLGGGGRERRAAAVDAIVHLAAVASVPASMADPLGTHTTNFDGTLRLLEAARAAGVRRFLYASSAAVYGDGTPVPLSEEANPRPLTPYAADKLAGEYYLGFYRRHHGLETLAFRFFNIYGPRQDPRSPYSGVISLFCDHARAGKAVTIHGDGQQTRDFVYVADLARLLAAAVTMPALPQTYEVINVGRGQECSLLELLETIEAIQGQRLERQHVAPRPGDIRRSCADISRLRDLFPALVPATPLREGLQALLAADAALSVGSPSGSAD
jgi:UDP-glucose 4-epimerase